MHMKFDDVLCLDDINLQCGVTEGDINCLNKLKVPLPKQEHDRIRTLREAKLFDTKPEEDYDRFITLAARALKVGKHISSHFLQSYLSLPYIFQ